MQPARHDITIIDGDVFQMWFRIQQSDGTVADPPNVGDGYTIGRMTVRDQYGEDGTDILVLDTDNGGLSLGLETDADGAEWSGYVSASAAATETLTDWGDGVYDLKISDGLHVYTVLFGTVSLTPVATESLP